MSRATDLTRGKLCSVGDFMLASSPGVGSSPQSVVAADVNGDGRLDLISANSSANTLTVLTNNGSGGFVFASSPGVGSGPFSVTAADVNGDGKPDLISANTGANTLTVLTNNGSGGFVLASSPGVGSAPYSVTAADVNGDGKPDLISGNYDDNALSVLTNNGSGGFVFASSREVGINPASVTAADVNGDGKVDLISANSGFGAGNTLTVLFNKPTFRGSITGDYGIFANVTIPPPGILSFGGSSFGASTRQMIDFYNGAYGIGTQTNTVYFRSSSDFAWYKGGGHDNRKTNAGGGSTLMSLSSTELRVNGTFVSASDRNAKENFTPINTGDVLAKVVALPLSKWNYKQDATSRHLGPMAQDFYAAFGIGPDDKHIATVDADGVALAAIQGLNQKVDSETAKLRAKNAELERSLENIEKLLNRLNTAQNGDGR